MKSRRNGISLAEILVVLTIIAILASLLLPVFSAAKRRSSFVVCASNMHQIYLAMKLYSADYDSYPPGSMVWPAFRPFFPTLLKCPASDPGSTGEFDYLMLGGPIGGVKGYDEALRACQAKREGDFPIVRDLNHMITTNGTHPDSRVLLVRENGAFSIIHPTDIISILKGKGLCSPILGFVTSL